MSAEDRGPEPVTIEITVDATSAIEALRRAQAGVLFAFHPDLSDLDDSMDNVFGGSFED